MSRTIFARLSRRAAVVFAAIALSATAATAAPTAIYDPIACGSRNVHSLWLGTYDRYVIVQGDGDTDLDCWLYDANGRLISSDTDATDTCVLPAPTFGTHRLVIRNLGRVTNYYAIWTEN